MNRSIQFRAFEGNEMLHQPTTGNYAAARFFGFLAQDSPIMQFIGIKDLNGKEIYEGDIAKVMLPVGGFWGSIKTERFGIVKYSEDKCRFIVEWNWSKNQHHIDVDCDLDIQVIGNIYQNAELLTKTICQTN